MSELKEEYVFESMDSFFEWINQGGVHLIHPGLAQFHEAYTNIRKGCGCNRKKRVSHAKNCYIHLKDLPDEVVLEFKRAFVAKKIILKHDNVVLGYLS